MTQIKTSTGLLIIFAAAVLIGGGALAWANAVWPTSYDLEVQMPIKVKKKTAVTTPTSTTADWKTLTLDFSKGKLKYPPNWVLKKDEEDPLYPDIVTYTINERKDALGSTDVDGVITEYKLSEWLKGPKEEGYNLSKEDRQKALTVIKDIYDNQQLTPETINGMSKLMLEFFTYSYEYRTDLKYLASSDNKSRGFSALNTRGQDVSISPDYNATLYNPEKNVVIHIWLRIPGSSKEVKNLNDRIEGLKTTEDFQGVDKQIHEEFKTLVESSKRSDLSFGSLMDTVDTAIKSLTF